MKAPLLVAALMALAFGASAKKINWNCVDLCWQARGWQPVCAADGTGWMVGTVYPNLCTMYNCVAPVVSPKAPKYDVMGTDSCMAAWLRGSGDPTKGAACSCDIWDVPDPWWPFPPPPPPKKCRNGRNGCQHCQTPYYCGKCFFTFRRVDGKCVPCDAGPNCLRCPKSRHICTYCAWPSALVNGKCIYWGKKADDSKCPDIPDGPSTGCAK